MDALQGKNLYYGNIWPAEPQFERGNFVGMALKRIFARDVDVDIFQPLPVPDNSVEKVQSSDVFEHVEYDQLPFVLDEIYRVLKPGGTFRLSMPDYRSPMHKVRSVYDEKGEVIADLSVGGEVYYDPKTFRRAVRFTGGGEAHVWFPDIDKVQALVARSALKNCTAIKYYHYFKADGTYVAETYPENDMFVRRAPPGDMRAGGAPISLVADFVK